MKESDEGGSAESGSTPEEPGRPRVRERLWTTFAAGNASIRVPPPPKVSTKPDSATRKAFTNGDAPAQVFHFKVGGVSYGTDDKGHAAAIILAFAILILIFLTLAMGMFVERVWIGETLKVLGSAFLIVAGVAVGKSVEQSKNKED